MPFLANTTGWLFTEMGRQPWIVQGLLLTRSAVSPRVGVASVVISLVGFAAVYSLLAVIEGWLMARAVKSGPEKPVAAVDKDSPLPPVPY